MALVCDLLVPSNIMHTELTIKRHRCFSVLAIELLAACQALEFLRPLKSTTPLEKVHELVRTVVRYDP